MNIDIIVPNKPQKSKSKWYAKIASTGDAFLIAQTVAYTDGDGKHRGLYQTRILNDIPALHYDRFAAEARLNLWAHFIWPSVTAESGNGHHLIINTYDRARFTFGFYQLAAHTPRDNLILLFRKLVQLPSSSLYFPDLFLKSGRLHRREAGKEYSLETVTTVHRPNGKIEKQLVAFMTYLNPDTFNANEREALNSAKLMHWLLNDRSAVEVAEAVAFQIMLKKLKKYAKTYRLAGKDPRLAIWVSDIRHQGRGGKAKIKSALSKPTLSKQLKALSEIDVYTAKKPNGTYKSRRAAVKRSISILQAEGRFAGVLLGDANLPL